MSIEVHIDWKGKTHFVGRLHTAERSSTVSFEYAADWLSAPGAFAIDPTSLPLRTGAFHNPSLFGAMQDCGPDRWGRMLIERAVRKQLLERKAYRDIDYVIALDDQTRIGALRFRIDPAGLFLASRDTKIPPVVNLAALLNAADAVHGDTETAQDLRHLLGAGSPLGGARPKSTVILPDGRLGIAKFSKPDDTRDIAAGEILALTLARQAGISVAEHQLVSVDGKNVALITRFDRNGIDRIPFLSANSLLALSPDDSGAYTLIADGIRQFGYDTTGELREMWKRLVFSLLVSNYDDHFRNHGFLMRVEDRWALSPAYDINPVPEIERALTPKTAITEDQEEPSVDVALKAAIRFGLKLNDAKIILREVFKVISKWRETGRRLRLKTSTLDAYASAFEHRLMDEARALAVIKG